MSIQPLVIYGAITGVIILIAIIILLRHELRLAKIRKFVLLISAANGDTSWKIFDSMAETEIFVKKTLPRGTVCSIIRAINVDKYVSDSC